MTTDVKKGSSYVSENEKTKDWIKERALRLHTIAKSNAENNQDIKCWRYFNNQYYPSDFEYLTKSGNFEFPAKLRWVPLQRQNANLLISTYTTRPLLFTCYLDDMNSKNKKFERQIKDFITQVSETVNQQLDQKDIEMRMVMQQKEQIMQMLEKEPESEEEAMQIEQIRQSLPMIEAQFKYIEDLYERQTLFTREQLQEMERFYRYDDKELSEEIAQIAKEKILKTLRVKDEAVDAFTCNIVTGKGYYLVEYQEGSKYPTFKSLNPLKVFFPVVDNIKMVNKGPWVAYEEGLSYEDIIHEYGHELNDDERRSLDSYTGEVGIGTVVPTPENGAVFIGSVDALYSGSYGNTSNNISVVRIFFKSQRKVYRKRNEKEFGDGKVQTFSHFIDEEAYKKLKDKSNIDIRFVDDIYEATIINGSIVVGCKKKTAIVRNPDEPSEVNLPIFGPAFNNITSQPFSIMHNTNGLQEFWCIVNYHEELLLAASGVRGQVVDMSQKPDSMSIEEQRYHKKLGTLYIQTVDKNGNPRNASFNQWRDFDDSVSPAIQYIEVLKQNIEILIGNMMGVPRARQGDIATTDQVGTFEKSIQQSSLITEILYYNHDRWLAEALSELINLALTFSYNTEQIIDIPSFDGGVEFANIPEHLFDNTYWSIQLIPGGEEHQKLVELKQFALQNWQAGAMNFNDFLSIYSEQSVVGLKKRIETMTTQAEKMREVMQQQQHEQAMEFEKAKVQFAKEYDMAMKQQEMQLKQALMELDKYKTDMQQQIDAARIEIEKEKVGIMDKKVEVDREVGMTKIGSEREIEMAYLQEQHRANTVNEQLKALELQLNTIIKANEMRLNATAKGVSMSNINLTKSPVQKKEKIKNK